jgi:hypothetical protein
MRRWPGRIKGVFRCLEVRFAWLGHKRNYNTHAGAYSPYSPESGRIGGRGVIRATNQIVRNHLLISEVR